MVSKASQMGTAGTIISIALSSRHIVVSSLFITIWMLRTSSRGVLASVRTVVNRLLLKPVISAINEVHTAYKVYLYECYNKVIIMLHNTSITSKAISMPVRSGAWGVANPTGDRGA